MEIQERIDIIENLLAQASLQFEKLKIELSPEVPVKSEKRPYRSYEQWRNKMRELGTFTAAELSEAMGAGSPTSANTHINKAIKKTTIRRIPEQVGYYQFLKPSQKAHPRHKQQPPEQELIGSTSRPAQIQGTGKQKSATTNPEIKKLVDAARCAGWRIDSVSNHIKVVSPSNHMVVMAKTPSDHRAIKNIRAELRRAGLVDV